MGDWLDDALTFGDLPGTPSEVRALTSAYVAGLRHALEACEERRAHFRHMARSTAAISNDEAFAHEAGECVEAIKTLLARSSSQRQGVERKP